MSIYQFISSDYELPLLDTSNDKLITVREAIKLGIKPHELVPWESMSPDDKVIIVDDENNLNRLVITKGANYIKNVRWYTDKPFIYSLELSGTESSGNKLLDYLKENINEGQKLELWSIWLDDKKSVKPIFYNYEDFSLYNLKQLYDCQSDNYTLYTCITIERYSK